MTITQNQDPAPAPPQELNITSIFMGRVDEEINFKTGILNLSKINSFDEVRAHPMPHKLFIEGVMGFRRDSKSLKLVIACGKTMTRDIALPHFIAMIENMDNDEHATILLENFTESEENRQPRGQILGRLNPTFSCITVVQGLTGRVIHSPADLARLDVYYLAKDQLAAYYIAAKYQIGDEDKLDEMMGAYDGWKAFNIPLDPCNPYE